MLKAAIELAAWDRLHSTSGGLSDTELNELAVSPTSSPLAVRAVTMVTPVANMASEARNSVGEKPGGRALDKRVECGIKKVLYLPYFASALPTPLSSAWPKLAR